MRSNVLKFQVQGRGKKPYTITAEGEGINFIMYCTCPAGNNGQAFCKHRRGLLYGEVTNLVQGEEFIDQLHEMARGSPQMAEADKRPLLEGKNLPPSGVNCIKSLSEISADDFSKYGYHTQFSEGSDPWPWQSFELFGYFKNGKLKKTPAFTISWEKCTGDLVAHLDGSTSVENIRERARPYSVRGKGGAALTARAKFDDAYDALIKAINLAEF